VSFLLQTPARADEPWHQSVATSMLFVLSGNTLARVNVGTGKMETRKLAALPSGLSSSTRALRHVVAISEDLVVITAIPAEASSISSHDVKKARGSAARVFILRFSDLKYRQLDTLPPFARFSFSANGVSVCGTKGQVWIAWQNSERHEVVLTETFLDMK
jgi:hypothetical protein